MHDLKFLLKLFADYDQEMTAFTKQRPKTKKEIKSYISPVCDWYNHTRFFIGEGSFVIFQKASYFNYLVHLYVEPENRRKGIATKLLKLLEKPIILECYKENQTALKFYKSLGFVRVRKSLTSGAAWYSLGDPDDIWLARYVTEMIDRLRIGKCSLKKSIF